MASSSLFSVAGKNVLVTGGSRGIGLMIASTFVRNGANVLLTSRDPKACEEAANSLLSNKTNESSIHHIPSNVSTREGCKALAQHTHQIFNGRLDILVNNAGTSWGEDPGYGVNGRESGKMNWGWDKVMDLNVKGMFYLVRECVPMLQRRRIDGNDSENKGGSDDSTMDKLSTASPLDPGRIINIGSVTGFLPQDAPTHAYDVSKAAVHHLTKKLAADLAPRGITVNAVAPGYVPTRMSTGLFSTWTEGDDVQDAVSTIPLGRMGNEDDMGGAVLYLSSRAGSWCTGVILNVDGGAVGAMQIPLSSL
mmetsp:Transcript_19370/g.33237  ORF Transcript_19370/g.33237 Transcript_19370/m.33237 type:complete len:307 (+) Transcript_19370:32-952(+)|eukprot:CAMPEP_0183705228 /NCGR_PEP_ID=MMETSP0737-20130205/2385_1 /TAXON_ID=385413 /ORGANISM="Thalassiosira miniscula, Strain CCMP1093" /LENGTH=306 /DNA_ID=CAMNT_0025932339 /DNA_START=32 /DNA_END=952 /DNA_ORIENTATION=-